MKIPKIGMRTIKTVIAVVLTLEISRRLNINSPILAGIAAIMTMETSVSESFSAGKFRMYGTILGAIVALVVAWAFPISFITTSIGLIIVIYLSNTLQWQDAAKMAMIVFLVIMIDFEEGYRLAYALNRTLDTFIGVIVGTAINYFIRPPKIDMKIYSIIEKTTKEIVEDIKELIWGQGEVELDNLKKKIEFIEENYETLKEDLRFKKSVSDITINYEDIFELFQNIYSHLRVIKLIDKKVSIDEKNKELLEKNFMRSVPEIKPIDEEELYVIYNYHLRKIIYDLKEIERLYESEEEIE